MPRTGEYLSRMVIHLYGTVNNNGGQRRKGRNVEQPYPDLMEVAAALCRLRQEDNSAKRGLSNRISSVPWQAKAQTAGSIQCGSGKIDSRKF